MTHGTLRHERLEERGSSTNRTAEVVRSLRDGSLESLTTREGPMIIRDADTPARASVLDQLSTLGQSLWYDNIRRGLMKSGELARMVREEGIAGITSNPSIFEKAIGGSTDYDDALRELVGRGRSGDEIVETLMIEDVGAAADVLRPVFDRTRGGDGYASIEVAPRLAHDSAATVSEGKRIWSALNRPNVMVKVPATKEGLAAITELTDAGVSVNVTLIFAVSRYEEVARAYMEGLERRVKRGAPISSIASIASFFVSRVDTAVDALLPESSPLRGRAGIANSKIAYARFRELFSSERWRALATKGARLQRVLWASTSTKNPVYRDVRYIEELIGPDTVNTVPQSTLHAFLDHGRVRASLAEDIPGARRALDELAKAGVDLAAVCERLLNEGVASFVKASAQLQACVESRREAIVASAPERMRTALGGLTPAVATRLEALAKSQFSLRLWKKDPTLWKDDPRDREVARKRLGWLTVIETMRGAIPRLRDLVRELKEEGYDRALLLGMGGSSLCPDVLAKTFGRSESALALEVLDTTDADAIRAAQERGDLARTVFIVSSKSGTTLEPLSLYGHFRTLAPDGRRFLAITDPGTPLEKLARENGFRAVFANPPDIGGRYSALSYFGLVPAALLGLDLGRLLDEAERMREACAPCVAARENPGLMLGTILGEAARAGRDKLTLALAPEIEALGSWIEQLIAESTGKDGRGIVPVEREPLGPPSVYGDDRLFVALTLSGARDRARARALDALENAGHPVVRYELGDRYELGAEFFRWEFATAVAGAILGLDPFNEPNVQEAKDVTREILASPKGEEPRPVAESEAERIYADGDLKVEKDGVRGWLGQHLARIHEGDYAAILAYVPATPEIDRELQAIRVAIRDRRHVATTKGYGPRYLHSTGQLHKGGPNRGVFLEITHTARDLKIPGEDHGFAAVERAQALGDLRALTRHGRRVLQCDLRGDVLTALRTLRADVEAAL
jgi:transaldolase/glucose-6-phosphate isomerase